MTGGLDTAEADELRERQEAAAAGRGRCSAQVRWNGQGQPLREARQCAQKAKTPGGLCGLHEALATGERLRVELVDGGVCLWCVRPARRYQPTGAEGFTPIALCDRCAKALGAALASVPSPKGRRRRLDR